MQRARDQFLARAALPQHQDRAVRVRDALNHLEHLLHLGRAADDLAELRSECSARATSSLPVPLSPSTRIVLSVFATRSIILNTSCILGALPMIWLNSYFFLSCLRR